MSLSNKSRDWERKIQEQRQSGLSVTRWCHSNQISYHTFLYWKRRFQRLQSIERKTFIEIQDTSPKSRIHLECNGIRIYVDKDFDAPTLAKCLQMLKAAVC